ncbi:hypothetical protein G6K83_32395 [Agrobacterium rhizogenes]|uniref:hypothetical protein n=1 Tax=Rhizobium rhizogenes TaxID=359 RepID=UPI001572B762|nr:hypothetical protein [Rhizobium rhizogenes]NTH29781.1 hypothetical protein [Rhizobium rhizogenes]
MVSLNRAQASEHFDFRTYVAMRRVERLRPPYNADLEVTPLSIFSQHNWRYPSTALPAGHRDSDNIDFLSARRVAGRRRFKLCPTKHELLLRQLKETLFGLIFHRHLLPWRADAIRASTIIHKGQRISQLFANFAAAGLTSLQNLSQEILTSIFAKLPVSAKSVRLHVADFRDMMILAENGLISEPFNLPNASIELPQIAEEIDKVSHIRTLQESEIASLLRFSKIYIDKAEDIAGQIILCRDGALDQTSLVDWAYENLPVRGQLWPRDVVGQLGWLVRIAAYQLIVFHLGSRSSEALSANEDAIFPNSDVEAKFPAFITLMIYKGSKFGEPRTFPVHPFLLRVGKATRVITSALGYDSKGPIFRKTNSNREIPTNSLNHRLRNFASMHGLDINFSSHSWRFSVADIVAGSAQNPFPAIQYQLGHSYLSEAIAYGLHGPSGDDIRASAIEAGSQSVDDFLQKCTPGLIIGGVQGAAISDALKQGMGKDELREQMTSLGITVLRVGHDRYCVKQADARGACSKTTKDTLPEIEHCQADCMYQAQFSALKSEWENFLDTAPEYYSSVEFSVFDKIRKTDELRKHVVAWPDLQRRVDQLISENPPLNVWFN